MLYPEAGYTILQHPKRLRSVVILIHPLFQLIEQNYVVIRNEDQLLHQLLHHKYKKTDTSGSCILGFSGLIMLKPSIPGRTIDAPVSALDAATGASIRTFQETEKAEELLNDKLVSEIKNTIDGLTELKKLIAERRKELKGNSSNVIQLASK